jgi:hypothetical protein
MISRQHPAAQGLLALLPGVVPLSCPAYSDEQLVDILAAVSVGGGGWGCCTQARGVRQQLCACVPCTHAAALSPAATPLPRRLARHPTRVAASSSRLLTAAQMRRLLQVMAVPQRCTAASWATRWCRSSTASAAACQTSPARRLRCGPGTSQAAAAGSRTWRQQQALRGQR